MECKNWLLHITRTRILPATWLVRSNQEKNWASGDHTDTTFYMPPSLKIAGVRIISVFNHDSFSISSLFGAVSVVVFFFVVGPLPSLYISLVYVYSCNTRRTFSIIGKLDYMINKYWIYGWKLCLLIYYWNGLFNWRVCDLLCAYAHTVSFATYEDCIFFPSFDYHRQIK